MKTLEQFMEGKQARKRAERREIKAREQAAAGRAAAREERAKRNAAAASRIAAAEVVTPQDKARKEREDRKAAAAKQLAAAEKRTSTVNKKPTVGYMTEPDGPKQGPRTQYTKPITPKRGKPQLSPEERRKRQIRNMKMKKTAGSAAKAVGNSALNTVRRGLDQSDQRTPPSVSLDTPESKATQTRSYQSSASK